VPLSPPPEATTTVGGWEASPLRRPAEQTRLNQNKNVSRSFKAGRPEAYIRSKNGRSRVALSAPSRENRRSSGRGAGDKTAMPSAMAWDVTTVPPKAACF